MKHKATWLAFFIVAAFNVWLSLPKSQSAPKAEDPEVVVASEAAPRAQKHSAAVRAARMPAAIPEEAAQKQLAALLAPPRFHPRPADEWQGMLVNINNPPPCDTHAACGLALSCQQGVCLPCTRDSECLGSEACALDHCVLLANVSCRHRSDCGRDSTCILTGYSSDLRNNADMKTNCISLLGGSDSMMGQAPTQLPAKDTRPSLPDDELFDMARRAAK